MARKPRPASADFTIEDLFGEEASGPVDPTPAEPPPVAVEETFTPPAEVAEPAPAPPPASDLPPGLRERIPPRPSYVVEWCPADATESGRTLTFDCGHLNFGSDAEHEAARAAGHCCFGGQQKMPIHWQLLRGPYLRPLPANIRRTRQRDAPSGGFPGYCCDDGGWYVGGLGNDCRHHRPEGAPLCTAHRPWVPPPEEPEVEEPTPEPEVTTAPEAGRKMSFKERQMAARRARKGR